MLILLLLVRLVKLKGLCLSFLFKSFLLECYLDWALLRECSFFGVKNLLSRV